MRWSIGRSKYGQVDETLNTSWSEFVDFQRDVARFPKDSDEDTKNQWFWVAPMILHPGSTHRTNADVAHMGGWFAADLDDGNWSLERLRSKLFGATYLLHTTTQSRPDAQRWRIMLLLDREYSPDEHARLWRWFNDKFASQLCAGTKNCSRIFYCPAQWTDADNVFDHSYGRAIHIDGILALTPEIEPNRPANGAGSALKPAPDGTPIVTDHMLRAAQGAPEGRRLFRLMCQAGKRFRLEGWTLTKADLAAAGLAASAQFAPGKRRYDIDREAERALAWVEANVKPLSAIERLRNRVLWERTRRS
jgi:hypothetical protein